jgi:tetratricopeptide (TPR) repeat protein
VGTKSLLKTVSSRGDGVDSILRKQIDELSREIAKGFGTEEQVTKIKSTPIIEATTQSMDAYSYFLRGRDEYEKFYYADAQRFLERAVELDPEFATAYSYLARIYSVWGNADALQSALEKLQKYGSKVSGKEGLCIQALLAWLVEKNQDKYVQILKKTIEEYPQEKRIRVDLASYYLGNRKFEEATSQLRRALELDPKYGPAMNLLAYIYGYQNKFDDALKYFQLYASVSPGDANPYDSMGDLYFRMGNLEEARKKYLEALRIKPDFGSGCRISYIYALTEDYEEAMKWVDQFIASAPSNGVRSVGYQLKAIYHYLFGNINLALEEMDKAQEISTGEKDYGTVNNIFRAKIWIAYDWGKYDLFLKLAKDRFDFRAEHKIQTELFNTILYTFYQGLGDVRQNRLGLAKSKLTEIGKACAKEKEASSAFWMNNAYNSLLSEISLSEGRSNEAIEAFKKMNNTPLIIGQIYTLLQNNIPLINDTPARAYVRAGQIDKAIAEYEKLASPDPQARNQTLIHPFSRYRLARLYEDKGERAKALAQYEKLAEIWKNADSGLPEVLEATRRLAALKAR